MVARRAAAVLKSVLGDRCKFGMVRREAEKSWEQDMADKEKALVEEQAKKLKGKKAKAISAEPAGTKAKPLDRKLRTALEETLGANLKDVKIHTGGNAADISKSLGAKAFAVGSDIYFSKPADAGNVKLVAHEVIHVLQAGSGKKAPAAKKGKALTSK